MNVLSSQRLSRLSNVFRLASALIAFATLGCERPPGRTTLPISKTGFLNIDNETAYVGDDECAVCHEDIFNTFLQTGMGRSFYSLSEDNLIEDFETNNHVYDPKSDFHYEMTFEDGKLQQDEYRLNARGERKHDLTRRAVYAVGSGNHARTYLWQEGDGLLFELPATWFSDQAKWALSPGYASQNLRFSRPVVEGCMNCHNSYSGYVEFSGNRYENIQHGIGCERCHGPGDLHIQKHYAKKIEQNPARNIDSTIVNPKHLSAALQMDVCYQCHLQGQVRVVRTGRKNADFKPGMMLSEVISVFLHDEVQQGDFRVASHGERIASSKCFIESNGALTCLTCHNPHEPVQWRSRKHFNEQCQKCHDPQKLATIVNDATHRSIESDCVACHMRQGAASDVIHANFTDHWIRKNIDASSDTLQSKASLKSFFGENDNAAKIRLGIAYHNYFEKHDRNPEFLNIAISLLREGLQSAPENANGLLHFGAALLSAGELEKALETFRIVARLEPENPSAHEQVGQLLQRLGHDSEAVIAYEKALDVYPDNAVLLTNLANIYAKLGDERKAISHYEAAQRVQPSYANSRLGLGELYAQKSQKASAAKNLFKEVLHNNPDNIRALFNLGNLAMQAGNYSEADKHFSRVFVLNPSFLPGLGASAYLKFLQGKNAEAIEYLRKILAIDPNNERAKTMLRQLRAPQ